jgi:[ribosomal protein S5]-alanine N-acetyltransferase
MPIRTESRPCLLRWNHRPHDEIIFRRGKIVSVIQTPRVSLRELDRGDAEFILELLNQAGFIRFIGDKGVRTLGDAREYILQGPADSYARNGFGLYAVCLREPSHDGAPVGTPIGICGLVKREGLSDPDVGFAFLSRFWSRGYAVESAAAVLAHARTALKLARIVAITSLDNVQSIAVLQKIGFKFERNIRLADHSPELKLFGLSQAEDR